MRWCAKNSDCSFDLVEVVVTREERSSTQELSEDAANGPNIQGVGVVRCIQDNLWRSVPSGHHVLCQRSGCLLIPTRQSEITNFQIATLIKQEVTWLQVSMDNIGGVNVEAASEQLIHEILTVIVSQVLSRVYDPMHVSLHQICDNINIFIASWSWRFLNVDEADDVLVIEEL